MADRKVPNVTVEDATILYRNFTGAKGPYNEEGDRNFNLILPDELVDDMIRDGWNIKFLEPREEGDPRRARVEVKINMMSKRPPTVVLISSRGRTTLGQPDRNDGEKKNRNADEINVLDHVNIKTVDLIVRGYAWDVNGKTGVKAYLQSIYVTIEENALELKYADIEERAQSAQTALLTREEPLDDEY